VPATDEVGEAELLHAEYERYDRCVDIVSAAEVWFTKASGLRDTVAHFERYPTITTGDIVATPDFTVLFTDGTAYIGELSNLSLEAGSLDSLCGQLGRYDRLDRVPGPEGELVEVTAVDVLLFVPHSDANSAVARMAAAVADEEHPYSPSRFPSVFAWSFDATKTRYVFTLASGASNQRPRGHGREPSLESWMSSPTSFDTLIGLPKHFREIKVARRFMNDPTPALYMATLLWGAVLPSMSGGEGDVSTSVTELADRLRHDYGRGKAADVTQALELLRVAGLTTREGEDSWVIAHQPINRHEEDLAATLIDRYKSRPSGPVTFGAKERVRKARRERESNKQLQTGLED
jgi:hypothetical protein